MDSRLSRVSNSAASPHPSLAPPQQKQGQVPGSGLLNLKNIGSNIGGMMGIAGNDERYNIPSTHKYNPEDGPLSAPQKYHKDDHIFCSSFNGKNILITGPTGNIGCNLFDLLQTKSQPSKIAIFIRDWDKLPQPLRNECERMDPQKRYFAYKVDFDFEDPKETQSLQTVPGVLTIAEACENMLKDFNGQLHHIFFCHGVINYMGGLEANLQEYKRWHVDHKRNGKGEYEDRSHEYGKVSKINVRATMQIMSICIPFMRFTTAKYKDQSSVTVLSASAGEYPWPGHTVFNMNMAALNMLVRTAAVENAAFNVRINAVAPGYVKNLNQDNARTKKDDPKDSQYQYFDLNLNPDEPAQNNKVLSEAANAAPLVQLLEHDGKREFIKTLQEPEEVAAEMLWLGSYSASFINGQVMVIDSGAQVTSADYDYWVKRQIKVDLMEYQKYAAKKS